MNKNLKNPGECPYCRQNRFKKYDASEVEQEINNTLGVNNEYHVIEYYGNKKNMIIKHNCGLIYQMTLCNFRRSKQGCPNCASGFMNKNFINPRMSINDIKNALKYKNPEYELISKYRTNRDTKLEFIHIPCGSVFKQKPSDANKDYALICPKCVTRSLMERKIKNFLENLNITFEEQKTFKDCLSDKGRMLRYDFYLPKYNILIEYDGEYHELPIVGINRLEDQIRRDNIKTNYCNQNRIQLIRINFKNKNNWDEILLDKLKLNNDLKIFLEGSTTIENTEKSGSE